MCSLLLSEEHLASCPGVVAEDIACRACRLRNDMFVMGGKIQGKPLLPMPEHLDDSDGTRTVLEWWVLGRTGSCCRQRWEWGWLFPGPVLPTLT